MSFVHESELSGTADPLISIVVPVLNMQGTIQRALRSILAQQYANRQIIVVDGKSSDDTLEQLEPYAEQIATLISEPDRGIYDAINKGLNHASGEIVGILNADDYYAHANVFNLYAEKFANAQTGIVFGDLEYFPASNPHRTIRRYSSRGFTREKVRFGWMPPHPATFVRRTVYESVGHYSTDFEIAGDFEFLVRALWVHSTPFDRIASVLVRMQFGGASTRSIAATYQLNREIIRACRQNGLRTGWLTIMRKIPQKLAEFSALLSR